MSHFLFSFFTDAHSLGPRYHPLLACCTALLFVLAPKGRASSPECNAPGLLLRVLLHWGVYSGDLPSRPHGTPVEALGHFRYFPIFSSAFLKPRPPPAQGTSSDGRSNLGWQERPLFKLTFTDMEKAHSGFDVGGSDVLGPLVPVTLLRCVFLEHSLHLALLGQPEPSTTYCFPIPICGS